MSVPTLLLLLAAAPSSPVDFDTGVLPVLAKAGCNTGACHGAAAGRGGFKLSLFGGDPAADHRAIVAELEGRRVNLAQPERSLLLLKPTWQLDHEGGQRFEADSEFARVLTEWIKGGAPRSGKLQVTGLSISTSADTVDRLPAELSLEVTARLSDGCSRPVTHLAIYTPADPAAIEFSGPGRIRVLRPGRHAIVVRFLTQVRAIQITAPYLNAEFDLESEGRNNWIDDEINATLAALRLPPSPQADDATLLRRITLDLIGRLPQPKHIREYLDDKSPQKFEHEVDRLLASPEFTEYWTFKLAQWLRLRAGTNDIAGTKRYFVWLGEQVAARRPLDALVADLIVGSGDSHREGPPNFHRSAADARAEAEHVSETLLAVRLRCANCHNHPLDRWTQDDYHGLAAIFSRLDRGRVVKLRATGDVVHPVTGEAAQPRIPGERFLAEDTRDGRPELAAWITAADNRYFARAWVNRLWESMLGRGLVHPTDDLRESNPATHPALLDRLAADFAANDHDICHTLRVIASSAAYQRSSQTQEANRYDDRFYSHAARRGLPPEVLLDMLCDATDLPNDYRDRPLQPVTSVQQFPSLASRAIKLYDTRWAAEELGPLATCQLGEPCQNLPPPLARLDDLANQLHWLNGQLVNDRIAAPDNAFRKLASSSISTKQLVEQYYLRTLSRLPSEAESSYWQAELGDAAGEQQCEDFAWSLLSCPEFVTNH